MNISARQSELVYALKVLGTVVDQKSTMPALGCVLVETDGMSLTLTATDLTTIAMVTLTPCNPRPFASKARACLPYKAFRDAVKDCAKREKKGADPWVGLESTGRDVTVSGTVRFTLEGFLAADYVDVKEPEFKTADYVQYSNLREALDFVAPAVCQDETRFHMRSVAFIGADVVATDGHRMHRVSNMPKVPGSHDAHHLIPHETVKALQTAMDGKNGLVNAWFKEWTYLDSWRQKPDQKGAACFQFRYKNCAVSISCKTIDSNFPAYLQVIPYKPDHSFTVDRQALANVCQAAKKSRGDYSRGLGFDSESPNFIRASVDTPSKKMAMSLSATIKGTVNICVNPAYLLDVLNAMSEETVELRHSGVLDPIRIDGPDRVAVIMPMHR